MANRTSRTAEFQAAFRAVETVRRPARSRLFEDPFALAFLTPETRRYVVGASLPLIGGLVRSIVERRSAGAMSSGIARTRLIDDWLREALGKGVRQVLLLGAGYDSRAGRLPELAACRIVELDLPATQAAKQAGLLRLLPTLPDNVLYLPADLTQEGLDEAWGRADLLPDEPVFVLWEGVAHYLGDAAVDATLRTLSRLCPDGSLLAFTYLHRGLLDGTRAFERAHIPLRRVALGNEPWIWGMDPARMPSYLDERGFHLLADLGADDYRRKYWGEEARRYRGFGFYHTALALVKRP